jgi:hypothetical protein
MSRALMTKRIVLGQVTVCTGCCCGAVSRGHPSVPVDWLKQEWRARGLMKRIQLTISGCVGPCDVPNVVVITSASGTEWLGGITDFSQYQALAVWASRSKEKGALLPLPTEFARHTLDPFRGQNSCG